MAKTLHYRSQPSKLNAAFAALLKTLNSPPEVTMRVTTNRQAASQEARLSTGRGQRPVGPAGLSLSSPSSPQLVQEN